MGLLHFFFLSPLHSAWFPNQRSAVCMQPLWKFKRRVFTWRSHDPGRERPSRQPGSAFLSPSQWTSIFPLPPLSASGKNNPPRRRGRALIFLPPPQHCRRNALFFKGLVLGRKCHKLYLSLIHFSLFSKIKELMTATSAVLSTLITINWLQSQKKNPLTHKSERAWLYSKP